MTGELRGHILKGQFLNFMTYFHVFFLTDELTAMWIANFANKFNTKKSRSSSYRHREIGL